MDPRMLEYYERELGYMRELSGEFAKEFPKIAGRLGLDSFECEDPYVERLLEGFAFLTARIQLKQDSEFPRFTEHLLEMLYPHYLAPMPSMAIAQLQPSGRHGKLTGGYTVPRRTILKSGLGAGEQTRCIFRTAHDVSLWPIELATVSHSAQLNDVANVNFRSERRLKGTLRLKLRTTDGSNFNELSQLDRVPFYVHTPRLFELIHGHTVALVIRPPDRSWQEIVRSEPVARRGFDDDDAVLPYGKKSFLGYRLLQEYFTLPQRFMFAEFRGLGKAIQRCKSQELEIIAVLDHYDPLIESEILPSHLSLHCTPIINLFERSADRIHLSNATHEYHLVPDRTRPTDLEVHSVTRVSGVGTGSAAGREFRPFYSASSARLSNDPAGFYTLHRAQSRLRPQSERRQSTYAGSEAFIALVDGNEGPFKTDLRQLSVDTLCTNRDLPMYLIMGQGRTDFHLETGAPVEAIRCLAGPTQPKPSNAWGHTSWQLISHLSLNHLSLTNAGTEGATALREMLQLYAHLADPSTRRQIDGVRGVSSSPIVRRLPGQTRASFARGLEIQVDCDEAAFEGGSVLLLGAVLESFFAKYASLNSFTETVVRTAQRGEIMRWPTRLGTKPTA